MESDTDQELLNYANKHFVLGTKFISHITDDGNVRECRYYHSEGQISFKWKISEDWDGNRRVRCFGGMSSEDGCSNPTIYNDVKGWCKIFSKSKVHFEKEKEESLEDMINRLKK